MKFTQKKKVLILENGINLTEIESTYIPLTNEVAEALTLIQYCDYSTWTMNQAVVVNGKNCQDYAVPAVGNLLYSILRMTSTELFLGRSGSGKKGTSEDDRFVEFEQFPYVKIK